MEKIIVFLLFSVILLFSCSTKGSKSEIGEQAIEVYQPNFSPKDTLSVAFLIINGVYNTEFTAAFDIFHHTIFRDGIKPMKVFSITPTDSIIKTFEGVKIIPDYTFKDSHPEIDILAVPSAEHHLDADLENEMLINWVSETGKITKFNISFCDGAFVFAKAGLLDYVECTTFPSDIDKMQAMVPKAKLYKDVLWVHDKNMITSSGGAKSFEPALYLCELLYGKQVAVDIAKGMVIDWNLNKHSFISPYTPNFSKK
ncbi:MAG: DJ-1/PfpI family protein [Bacteroidia bacterium]